MKKIFTIAYSCFFLLLLYWSWLGFSWSKPQIVNGIVIGCVTRPPDQEKPNSCMVDLAEGEVGFANDTLNLLMKAGDKVVLEVQFNKQNKSRKRYSLLSIN